MFQGSAVGAQVCEFDLFEGSVCLMTYLWFSNLQSGALVLTSSKVQGVWLRALNTSTGHLGRRTTGLTENVPMSASPSLPHET